MPSPLLTFTEGFNSEGIHPQPLSYRMTTMIMVPWDVSRKWNPEENSSLKKAWIVLTRDFVLECTMKHRTHTAVTFM
jgi:hypothetical protein